MDPSADPPAPPSVTPPSDEIATLCQQARAGDASALQKIVSAVYPELRRRAGAIMRHERDDHTLSATALVNEAYLRIIDQRNLREADQNYVVRACVTAMRRVLVDHARSRGRDKRGGANRPVTLMTGVIDGRARAVDLLDLDAALAALAEVDRRAADLVELRFIGCLDMGQIAKTLSISERTAHGDWSFAKAWLAARLADLKN